jgi:hypothetical protein
LDVAKVGTEEEEKNFNVGETREEETGRVLP